MQPPDPCGICRAAPQNALRLDCGHAFCGPCIAAWFNRGHNQCPLCRAVYFEAAPPPAPIPPLWHQRALGGADVLAGALLSVYNALWLAWLLWQYGTLLTPHALLMRLLYDDWLALALFRDVVVRSVYAQALKTLLWPLQFVLLQSRCVLFFRLGGAALRHCTLAVVLYAALYWAQHWDAVTFFPAATS